MKSENSKEKTKKKVSNTKSEVTKKNNAEKNDKKKTVAKKEESVKVEKKSIDVVEEKVTPVTEKKSSIKRSDLFLIIGLIAVVVLGFLLMRDKNAGPSYELPLTLSGEAGLQQLTYAEYQKKIDNDDEFVVILERATCSHCITYLPVAEQFASDNGLPMYYVDTDTFSSDDWETFEKSNSFLKEANGYWGTPTTIVLAGSEAVDYIEGETTSEKLLELYNKYFDMNK